DAAADIAPALRRAEVERELPAEGLEFLPHGRIPRRHRRVGYPVAARGQPVRADPDRDVPATQRIDVPADFDAQSAARHLRFCEAERRRANVRWREAGEIATHIDHEGSGWLLSLGRRRARAEHTHGDAETEQHAQPKPDHSRSSHYARLTQF